MKKFIVVLVICSALIGCKKDQPRVDTGESSCEFVKRVLYPDCSFRITPAAQEALGKKTSIKLDAVKRFFRGCPQYKQCLVVVSPAK